MAFQFREFHASAISKTSRTACGERPFSSSSRWHCRASFSAPTPWKTGDALKRAPTRIWDDQDRRCRGRIRRKMKKGKTASSRSLPESYCTTTKTLCKSYFQEILYSWASPRRPRRRHRRTRMVRLQRCPRPQIPRPRPVPEVHECQSGRKRSPPKAVSVIMMKS
jgi:hypothetical protein